MGDRRQHAKARPGDGAAAAAGRGEAPAARAGAPRRKGGLLGALPRFFLAAGRYVGYDRAARAGEAAVRAAGLDRRAAAGRAQENLKLYFPEADEAWVEETARAVRRNAVRAKLFDKYFLPGLPDAELDRVCRWVGDGELRRAAEAGRGVVAVSLHYGRFWAAPVSLTRGGAPVLAFQVGEQGLPMPERTLSEGTLRAGDLSAPLRAVRALRRGAVIFIQLDAGRVERPLVVSFLGRPTRVARSPLEIARAAGALVIPMLSIPSGDRIELTCYEAVDARGLAGGEPAEETMRRLLEPLERQVRRDPSWWFGIANAHRRLADPEGLAAGHGSGAAAPVASDLFDE